jgi:membrane dipeptidase
VSARKQLKHDWMEANPPPEATLRDVVAHAVHMREVAGIDHLGIGGDYDGTDRLPAGLEDVSRYPALIAALLELGWSEQDCGMLANANLLRVLHDAEAAAAAIRSRRGPSAARIEDLDAVPGPVPAS